MNKKSILCLILTVILVFTTVYADKVRFVSAREKTIYEIISIIREKFFGKKVITTDAELTAKNGELSVTPNNYAEGKLEYTFNKSDTEVKFSINKEPKKGTVDITDNTKGEFIYAPQKGEYGEDKFTFYVESGKLLKSEGTITINISDEITAKPSPTSTPDYSFVYEDMKGSKSGYSASKLAENGIFKGECIGGKYYFHPDYEITRGEFLIYLISALNINTEKYNNSTSPFTDFRDIPSWLSPAAKVAYDAGIITGNSENGRIYLRPNDTLTRIEAITIINNTLKPETKSANKANFEDIYLVPEWGQDAVKKLADCEIINGYSDNTIRPFVKVTRADASEFIWQIVLYIKENPNVRKEILSKIK